jgi:thiamine-phosphate pyrophosphorylase
MPSRLPTRGLYVLTDPDPAQSASQLAGQVGLAVEGGAVMVQYRDKQADESTRLARARALAELCQAHDVPLIINDDPGLARAVGADGVHLGRHDPDLARARALLGPGSIIGVSCYDDIERARRFVAEGADYIAFGSFFPSRIKPDAVRAPTTILHEALTLNRPRVAIGGIEPHNAASLIGAGADLIAVISGVFAAPDVRAAAARYVSLFDPGTSLNP